MATDKRKPDFQTLSLFLALALLTGVFIFGLRWITLAPETNRTPALIEPASK